VTDNVSGKLAVTPCTTVVSFELCGSEKNRGTNSRTTQLKRDNCRAWCYRKLSTLTIVLIYINLSEHRS